MTWGYFDNHTGAVETIGETTSDTVKAPVRLASWRCAKDGWCMSA